jgi:hypothetical protein
MLANCKAYGLTPLTREEFEQEDKRMLVEAVRRRNGLSEGDTGLFRCLSYY